MKYLHLLKNKYILTSLLFLGWMLFLDANNIFSQYKLRSVLETKLEKKEYLIEEIINVNGKMLDLTTNPKTLEKFARENYLMKKENEVIFVIVDGELEELTSSKATLSPF